MKLGIYLCVFLLFCAKVTLAQDIIVKKDGSEISCKVLKMDAREVVYAPIVDNPDMTEVLKIDEIFMIKFENGTKKVFGENRETNAQNDSLVKHRIGVNFNLGSFGLYNVNNVFTKADYTLALISSYDRMLSPKLGLGTEVMVLLAKPKTPDNFRMILNANVKVIGHFPLTEKLYINPQAVFGFSFWPESSSVPYLDSTFNELRIGWNTRFFLGFEYVCNKKLSISVDVGYSASSSCYIDSWITHDMMMLGIGPVFKF